MSINIYSAGVVACSVCAPPEMTQEEVEAAVNAEAPTGIDSHWAVTETSFAGGEPNPVDVEGCGRHWLLTC